MGIKNLTRQFRMPVDTDIHTHWCRLDLLMDYTDLLQTTTATPKISQEDRKQYFFDTFPPEWRRDFIDTKTTDFYDTTVADIKQFMIMKKKKADAEKKKKNQRDHDDYDQPSNKRFKEHEEGSEDGDEYEEGAE